MFKMQLYYDKRITGPFPHSSGHASKKRSDLRCSCELCTIVFDSDTEVQVHRSIVHQETLRETFQSRHGCYICLQTFEFTKQLIAHIRRAHLFIKDPKTTKITRPVHICDICSSLFFNKLMLAFHMQFRHKFVSKRGRVTCPKCLKPLRPNSMFQHMDVIHTRSLKSCPFCFEYQPTMESYYAHIESTHAATLKCNFCTYIAETEAALNSHLEEEHGRKTTSVDGVQVAREFFMPHREPERMIRLRPQFIDRGMKLYDINVCVLCQETCSNLTQMRNHLAKEHGHNMIPEEPPQETNETTKLKSCDCGATFKMQVMLRHHIFREHEMGHVLRSESCT